MKANMTYAKWVKNHDTAKDETAIKVYSMADDFANHLSAFGPSPAFYDAVNFYRRLSFLTIIGGVDYAVEGH